MSTENLAKYENEISSRGKHWQIVSLYGAVHFFADFACAFLVFRFLVGTPEAYLGVLLYNFCAFAMRMPLGIIADKLNKNYLFAILSAISLALLWLGLRGAKL